MTISQSIGIIGGGNIGKSIIGGLIQQGFPASLLTVSTQHKETGQQLQTQYGIKATTHNAELAAQATVIILAVKPQTIREVLEELTPHLQPEKHLLISVASGITTQQMQRWAGNPNIAIIRAMPNTPAIIGEGITALFATAQVLASQREVAAQLLHGIGETIWIEDESLMDAITALSGSGPAYFFYIMECFIQGAQALGIPLDIASKLTIKTALGSALLAAKHPTNIAQLRKQVTSPGGTTEAGIQILKDGKLSDLLAQTLLAATQRGKLQSQNND